MRLVKITTDDGLTGWGETTLEGRPRSTSGAVEEIADYLIGKDPLRIQHHWQHVYRSAFFRGGKWRAHEPPSRIDAFVECAYKMREWVGPDVELCFDFHGKMTPALAVEICHELKGMHPMFVEEPVPQENVDALKEVSSKVPFPIANMAEVYYMHIMPHCAIGPVAFTASLHVDAAVPNFIIQEQIDQGLGAELLKEDLQVVDGHIELPTKPGLGIDIDEEAVAQHCQYSEELGGEHFYESDGSVADW